MWPFTGYSSHELVVNCTNSSLKPNSSPISHTHPLQINPHKYREMIEKITIKFGTELMLTKGRWKSQLYKIKFCLEKAKPNLIKFFGLFLESASSNQFFFKKYILL